MVDVIKLHGDISNADQILEISNDLRDELYYAEFSADGQILDLKDEEEIKLSPYIPTHLQSGIMSFPDDFRASASGMNMWSFSPQSSGILSFRHDVNMSDGDPLG